MSLFFDFDVGPTGRRFRRAVDEDQRDIELIWNRKHTDTLFNVDDIGSLIELSALSICMINERKEVIGFVSLSDHPNVPSVDPAHWEMWIRNLFQRFYLSRNTLFIHFMCCIDSVTDFFLEEALISVFHNDVYLMHICLVVPQSVSSDCISRYHTFKKKSVYKHRASRAEEETEECYYLYSALRQDFCPKLKMRRAVEEDNDDIVEMLDQKCPHLKDLYGSYYISEILGHRPESKRTIIVAENHERAVGVMCLSAEVNYRKLQNSYELTPYHGLVKATPLEKECMKRSNALLKSFGNPIMMGKWSPFDRMTTSDTVHIEDIPSKERINLPKQNKGKVNFGKKKPLRRSSEEPQLSEDYSEKQMFLSSPTLSQIHDYSVTCLLEEEPFDYDIVNIDTTLLTIPDVTFTSFDHFSRNKGPRKRFSQIEMRLRKLITGRSSMVKMKEEPMPLYSGEPDAFAIELFGHREDIHDSRLFHLLEAAFEIMKAYDYCLIRVPCADKGFPLLQHFTYVPTKSNVCCKYALYIAHRNSILGKLRVRRAEISDVPQITILLENLDGKETIWTVENSVKDGMQYQAYVFLVGMSLIGIGILEPPEQTDCLRSQFSLDTYQCHKYHVVGHGISCGFASLKTVIVYPVFETHFRFFAREMLRQSGCTTLIWLTAYRNKWVAHKANAMATAMVPLLPRKSVMEYGFVPELKTMLMLDKNVFPFSAWFLDKKLSCVPKLNVDTRIVILGASRTAMAFLNTLLFSETASYLTFTSVTLISPNGLPYARKFNPAAAAMFPNYRTGSDRFMKSTPYTYYVNIVHGIMVEINQQNKFIKLENGTRYHYDLLFMLFGMQYQHPEYFKPLLEKEREMKDGNTPPYERLDIPKFIETEPRITDYGTPENVFIINNIIEANIALKYVNGIYWEDDEFKVIVYGATIHAYCCLTALLEMRIPTENIVFVDPFPPENRRSSRIPIFCNSNVERTIGEVLASLKITVYRSYYFRSWICDRDGLVTHAEFMSHFKMVRLQCSALFYYGKVGINSQAFVAINKCGLVYDGGVCIDHQFRTKDHSIYAAGPATRYSRRYFAESKRQKYYDSYEVGKTTFMYLGHGSAPAKLSAKQTLPYHPLLEPFRRIFRPLFENLWIRPERRNFRHPLGTQIRNQLDPLFSEKEHTNARQSVRFSASSASSNCKFSKGSAEYLFNGSLDSKLHGSSDKLPKWTLPDFKTPVVWHCTLPGNLQYLEVRSPGRKIPHQYVQSLQYNGFVLETFKQGYFKLHLTNEFIVDGITCLSPQKYSLENFKNLYGRSCVMLNNVHLRYTLQRVDDFYQFFRSPWAVFLYHEHLDELLATVKELVPKGLPKGETIREALRNVGDKFNSPSGRSDMKLNIRVNFEKSPHFEAITDYVIEWLSANDILLPMYLRPEQMIEFSYDLDRHPAFRKKKSTVNKMLSKIC